MVAGRDLPDRQLVHRGLAFYEGGNYPRRTTARCSSPTTRATASGRCRQARTGCPNPAARLTFAAAAANPVDLEIGPGGDLFYADFDGGTIRRIRYFSANRPPVAVATANPTTGAAPLTVTFNGTGSSDPDAGDTLTYAWDLDGDGDYDDSTAAQPTRTYTAAGQLHVRLRVTDAAGASNVSDRSRSASATRRRRRRSRRPPPGRPGGSATSSPSPARRPTPSRERCRPAR